MLVSMNAAIAANLAGLIALAVWMISKIYPLTRAVRLRNGLLAREATLTSFDWTPSDAPGVFLKETRAPSRVIADALARVDMQSCTDDWTRALRLAEHLTRQARDLGAIQSDLNTTYARIRDGYGYCADFVKVFLALAHAGNLFARQWAFSFDGFGGHGHTVVEVFDRQRGRWLFMDVYNNFHVCDAQTMEPLGALAFRDALLHGTPPILVKPNGAGRAGYPIEEKLLDYYRSGLQEWYLLCGNAVFSYDAHPLVRLASRLSGGLGQIVATFIGVYPAIHVLRTAENGDRVQQLSALAHRFRLVLGLFALLLLILVVQLAAQRA